MIGWDNRWRVVATSRIREDFLEEVVLELETLLSERLRLKVLNVSLSPAWAALNMDLWSLVSTARNHSAPKPGPS